MIKAKVSADYKDIERIFAGGAIQKEIIKVWSTEANDYVFEAWKVLEMEGPLPLTFNANGEPLIDYRIYGNTEQTGTPTPENPIMPIGCGEKTENIGILIANNLIFVNGQYTTIKYTKTGINIIISMYAANFIVFSLQSITSDMIGESFAVSWTGDDNKACEIGLWDPEITIYNKFVEITRSARVITITNDMVGKDIAVRFYFEDAGTYVISNFMLNAGTQPLPYTPYGYKLPILSNSTVTNIYLGEVQTTRRIKKLVLTGEENWNPVIGSDTQSRTYISFNSASIGMCTHYASGTAMNPGEFDLALGIYLRFNITDVATTRNEWIDFLAAQYAAGTPVTVWYVLAEPETAVVNEPLMKIGEYVDTVDSAQTNEQIPTITGTNVIDYDGGEKRFITSDGYELVDKNQNGFLLSGSTLSPEKMYIKYKGR